MLVMMKMHGISSCEYGRHLANCDENEEVVISGISGVFPKCQNVSQLAENLFAKKDLISDIEGANFSLGKISGIEKFDAAYFGINTEHADYMDPMCRILLEKTFEAIVDSGYNPEEFRGSNAQVFVANCTSDAEVEGIQRSDVKGAIICERAQAFLANRISYCFGLHGMSCTLNTACSSSLHALQLAFQAIRNGECDSAIVGGSNMCLSPDMLRSYKNLGITSNRCRSFDDKAVGFCRSEAVCVIFLQKRKYAHRIYARVVHVKSNSDGFKKQSILFPSHTTQKILMESLYRECGLAKSCLSWVEAHGTGTRVGDYQEMKSLDTLCEGRKEPLLAGCVKSNIGHSESASGLCSIAKVIIAMEMDEIPPNVNFESPQNGIDALKCGRIRIATESTPWTGGYVAVNNFGIGGSNSHLLLKSNDKKSEIGGQRLNEDFLVTVSGRTEKAVDSLLDFVGNNRNAEFIGMIHQIYKIPLDMQEFRGYTIVNPMKDEMNLRKIQKTSIPKDGMRRPLWFIFGGMGSQWPTMGKALMKIRPFRDSILQCCKILKNKSVDLMKIITNDAEDHFQYILNCFVGITAIQISLVDTLKALKILPDGLIGHSFGEIACAYADGHFTLERAIMAAYYRGFASLEGNFIPGAMAVVGLNGNDVDNAAGANLSVACWNSCNNCTISGPAEQIEKFVQNVKSRGIYAKEIFSCNIPYHSPYVSDVAKKYEIYTRSLICRPKLRSSKWVTTSFPESEWRNDACKYCSSVYFFNNVLNAVYFETAVKYVPSNAIVVEISPDAVLKRILNDSLPPAVLNLHLSSKYAEDNAKHFLQVLGTLFTNGVHFDVSALYPPLKFPVSSGTPMIAPLIEWDHSKDWYVPYKFYKEGNKEQLDQNVKITPESDEFTYLLDHIADGNNILPQAAYLVFVWNILDQSEISLKLDATGVVFEDVRFHQHVTFSSKDALLLNIVILKKGNFEVTSSNGTLVADGVVYFAQKRRESTSNASARKENYPIRQNDIYKEFRLRGYELKGLFRGMLCCNVSGTKGRMKWRSTNWIARLDSLLKFSFLGNYSRSVQYVTSVEQILINSKRDIPSDCEEVVSCKKCDNNVYSDYVDIRGIEVRNIPRNPGAKPTLNAVRFVPFMNEKKRANLNDVIPSICTILLENGVTMETDCFEFSNKRDELPRISNLMEAYFKTVPSYRFRARVYDRDEKEDLNENDLERKCTKLFIASTTSAFFKVFFMNVIDRSSMNSNNTVMADGNHFTLIRQSKGDKNALPVSDDFKACAVYVTKDEKLTLWHKKCVREEGTEHFEEIPFAGDHFEWIKNLQFALKRGSNIKSIVLHSSHPVSGLLGFHAALKREIIECKIRCVFIADNNAPAFAAGCEFYTNQLEKGLAVNVYKNGAWGCYVSFPFSENKAVVSVARSDLEIRQDGSFTWVSAMESPPNVIYAHYLGANGVISGGNGGMPREFSGRNAKGERVAGLIKSGKGSTQLNEDDCYYAVIPNNWSMEDAATVPYAYAMVLSSIYGGDGKISGRTLIVNGAKSSFGRAAIHVASHYNLEIFALDDYEKSDMEEASRKKITYANSNDADDLNMISRCLLGKQFCSILDANFDTRVAGLLTRYAEKGRYFLIADAWEASAKMRDECRRFIGNAAMEGVKYETLSVKRLLENGGESRRIFKLFELEMKSGAVRPLPRRVCEREALNDLRLEQEGRQLAFGRLPRLVIKIRTEAKNGENIPEDSYRFHAEPRFACSPLGCHIICGGLGGMGFETCNWLVEKGAKNLVLVSRTGTLDGYMMFHMERWKRVGVNVVISKSNISVVGGVDELIQTASHLGPVVSVFNAALVLRDAFFENQNEGNFKDVFACKAAASLHLDAVCREKCPHLKHFVVFSSIACGYGNAGQSNYGAANSVMERICEARAEVGLPAIAIRWAGVDDVGYLLNSGKTLPFCGTASQPIRSCLSSLEMFLFCKNFLVSSFVLMDENSRGNSTNSSGIVSFLGNKLGKNLTCESKDMKLSELGIDSIAIVETRQILRRDYNLELDVKETLNLTVSDLEAIQENQKFEKFDGEFIINANAEVLESFYGNLLKTVLNGKEIVKLDHVVRLPSLLDDGSTIEKSTVREKTIFTFPGIEGLSSTIAPLAKNIDLQVLCFQYGLGISSIDELSATAVNEIKNRLPPEIPFNILGYSFGGLVAMRVVELLEEQGYNGILYMIDSSPNIVRNICQHLFLRDDFKLGISAFLKSIHAGNTLDSEIFEGHSNWSSACSFALSKLPKTIPYDKEHLFEIFRSVHERKTRACAFEKSARGTSLNCKIVCVRPKGKIFPIFSQHRLSQYFKQPVEECVVEGNHFSILQAHKLAYIIMNFNRMGGECIRK